MRRRGTGFWRVREGRGVPFSIMGGNDSAAGQLADAVRTVLPSARADLERLLRIPSVSADPEAAPAVLASANQAAALLRAAGLPEVDVVAVDGGQPAVIASRPGPWRAHGAAVCPSRCAAHG